MSQLSANPTLVIALPVALGVLAVYLLLPQPRVMPRLLGIIFGAMALALSGIFLLREVAGAHWVEAVLFYSFSALAIIGGVLLVTNRNPARGAVSFALVVLSVCGLFLLQAAPFLMAGAIIIYAGAIVVTFLFVIMLSQQHGPSDADARTREPLLACLAGGLLLAVLLSVIRQNYDSSQHKDVLATIDAASNSNDKPSLDAAQQVVNGLPSGRAKLRLEALIADYAPRLEKATSVESARQELALLRSDAVAAIRNVGDLAIPEYMPLSAMSGTPPNRPVTLPMPAGNVAALGRSLFSEYLLAVELAGTLLLVATIGAIAITHRTPRAAT